MVRQRLFGPAIMALLFHVSVVWADSPAVSRELDLKANWLDGQSTITEKHMDRMIGLLESDPQTKALLAQAMSLMATNNARDLMKIVVLCDDSENPGKHGQATFKNSQRDLLPASPEDLISGREPEKYLNDEVEQVLEARKPYLYHARYSPDYVEVRTLSDPVICVNSTISIGDAFQTFVHELTHIVQKQWVKRGEEGMLAYKDADDYALKTVLGPGDEVDAFIAGFSARVRLENSRASLPGVVRPLFNEAGEFVGTREEMARIILSDGGFGYRNGRFGTELYRNQRTGAIEAHSEYTIQFNSAHYMEKRFRNTINIWLENARANAEIFRHSVEEVYPKKIKYYESKIARAQKRKDAAAEQAALNELVMVQQKLEVRSQYLKAYEARIERLATEIEKRDERISRYEAIVAASSEAPSESNEKP